MATKQKEQAEVTRIGVLDMQVCVPAKWTNAEVEQFANMANLCGTTGGWRVRKDRRLLAGDPVRNPCTKRKGFVHVMLDC
jgi:hypothetical protein